MVRTQQRYAPRESPMAPATRTPTGTGRRDPLRNRPAPAEKEEAA